MMRTITPETRLNISDDLTGAGHANWRLLEVLTMLRGGLKIPSVSCSDMYISDPAPDELCTFDQAGRCCSDSQKLDVYPICDVTCERARSPYRNHRLLTRVTEWKRRVGLYFSHLSHVLQTN